MAALSAVCSTHALVSLMLSLVLVVRHFRRRCPSCRVCRQCRVVVVAVERKIKACRLVTQTVIGGLGYDPAII
jgi:hypothetical protein